MIEFLVNESGGDKVLFAANTPVCGMSSQLGWGCCAYIFPEDKKNDSCRKYYFNNKENNHFKTSLN